MRVADLIPIVGVLMILAVLAGIWRDLRIAERVRDPWKPIRQYRAGMEPGAGLVWRAEAAHPGEVRSLVFVESGLPGALDWCEMQVQVGARHMTIHVIRDPRAEIETAAKPEAIA